VEHGYQAAKTLIPAEQQLILNCKSPGQAKREGKKVTMRADWDQVKANVMLTLVRSKFQQDTRLAGQLLATGDELLREGNYWHDNYWGSCKCTKCGDNGKNMLGNILMQVRAELKGEAL
jgi:ribA/ribD-fused uncharacterized protein